MIAIQTKHIPATQQHLLSHPPALSHMSTADPSSSSYDFSITLLSSAIRGAIITFDGKEHAKRIVGRNRYYNYHALPLYLAQADNVILDIQLGAPVRAAIIAGFNGRLCDAILRSMKLPVTTKDERRGSGIYQPISKNHPEA